MEREKMNQKEIREIVEIECAKHSLCTDNGICRFYSKFGCLMVDIPKTAMERET